MSESQVLEFLIKAQNQANAVFDQARKSVSSLTDTVKTAAQGWTDITFAWNAGVGAANSIISVVDGIVQTNMEYAKQVKDLSRTIGASAEDASMLIQAGDDVQVSYETILASMEAAIKKGIEPSIEGIGKLADQYLAIGDPIAQTRFLMDNFGRSGADLAPLMQKGSQGIREMGEEAKKLGLVFDDVDLEKMEAYRQKVDDLGDKWQALTLKIGPPLIDTLSSAMDGFNTLAFGTSNLIETLKVHNDEVIKTSGSYEEYVKEMDRARAVAMQGATVINGYAGMVAVAASDVGKLTQTEYEHAKAMAEITKKYNEAGGAAAAYGVIVMNNQNTSRGMLNQRAGYGNYYTNTYNAPEPGRAGGGPMWAGVTRWVGENGPEPFTPNMDGWIGTPPGGGGGSVQINLSFPSMFPPSNPGQLVDVLRPAAEQVVREMRRNGQI